MREFQRPVLHSRKGVAECQEPTGEARGSAIGVRRSVSRASRMVVVVGGGGAVGSVSSTFFHLLPAVVAFRQIHRPACLPCSVMRLRSARSLFRPFGRKAPAGSRAFGFSVSGSA